MRREDRMGASTVVLPDEVDLPRVVRGAVGSTNELADVRGSMNSLVSRYVKTERLNELVRNLYGFAEQNAVAAAPYAAIIVDDAVVDNGANLSFDDIDAKDMSEVRGGAYVIRGWQNGERISLAVNRDVYDAFNYLAKPSDVSLKSRSINAVLDAARKVSAPIKGAITGYNPFFGVMNMMRDFQTASVNTEASALRFYGNLVNSIGERGSDSTNWRNFQSLGGASSGYISSQLGIHGTVEQQNKPGRKLLRKAGKAMSAVGEYTESMFRFAEYLEGIRKYGDTPEGRRKAIGMSADVTVNFSRSGPIAKAADSMCLYLNANVQGLDKMARTIAKHPVRTAARGLAFAGLAALLRYAFDHDDNPHYQNLTNYVKDNNYLIPNALGRRDENGYCTTFIKLPKSREYGVLMAATFERCCRFADGESFEDAFADLVSDIGTNLNVSLSPFWSPISDAEANKNFFGSNIVPSYMQYDQAPEQKDAHTSVVSSAISERLYEMGVAEVSPMKIDYVINQLGGFYGGLLVDSTAADSGGFWRSMLNTVEGKFVADPLYSSGVVSRFYDALDDAGKAAYQADHDREYGLIKKDVKTVDEKGKEALDKCSKEISALRKQEREILASEPDSERRKRKIDNIRIAINEVAARGLETWNGRNY